jgi:hypothetical protein
MDREARSGVEELLGPQHGIFALPRQVYARKRFDPRNRTSPTPWNGD